jgi:hypothetical protein
MPTPRKGVACAVFKFGPAGGAVCGSLSQGDLTQSALTHYPPSMIVSSSGILVLSVMCQRPCCADLALPLTTDMSSFGLRLRFLVQHGSAHEDFVRLLQTH